MAAMITIFFFFSKVMVKKNWFFNRDRFCYFLRGFFFIFWELLMNVSRKVFFFSFFWGYHWERNFFFLFWLLGRQNTFYLKSGVDDSVSFQSGDENVKEPETNEYTGRDGFDALGASQFPSDGGISS